MPAKNNEVISNYLLDGLPLKLQKSILGQCDVINITFGEVLYEKGELCHYVLYPLTGFISLLMPSPDHPPLEMGLIGNEGMLGVTRILGVDTAPYRAVVQSSGTALKLAASPLKSLLKNNPLLLKRLNLYLYMLMKQQSLSLACMRFHHIEPRLARWLLMTSDRAHSNHFYLTHQYLADMLGVRRSGITVAAGALQEKQLIAYTRGDISIIDRDGLVDAACGCYKHSKENYDRLLN